MSITLREHEGSTATFAGDVVSVGRDSACDFSKPQDHRLQPRHAVIRKMAGRWLVESVGDWEIRVGDSPAGRMCWVKPGDIIHLTENGPRLLFDLGTHDTGTSPLSNQSALLPGGTMATPDDDEIAPPLPAGAFENQGHSSRAPRTLSVAEHKDKSPPTRTQSEGSTSGADSLDDDSPPPLPGVPMGIEPSGTLNDSSAWKVRLRDATRNAQSLGKAAALLVAKQSERAKINSIDLPQAYTVLGRDVHSRGAYREDCPDLYLQIDDLLDRLRKLEDESSKQSHSSESFTDKAKAAALTAKQKAEAQAIRLQASRLMSRLGESVYKLHGPTASSPETTGAIVALLARASSLAEEVEQQRQASGSRFITLRRVVVSAGLVCVAACLFLPIVGTTRPNPKPFTIAGASDYAPRNENEQSDGPDTPTGGPDLSTVDYSYDFSQDDYETIPQGAKRETRMEPYSVDRSLRLEREGYVTQNGQFVEHGLFTLWRDPGRSRRATSGRVLHGRPHGVKCEYYEDGSRRAEFPYVNGEDHGLARLWYPNGTQEAVIRYFHGKRHGKCETWYENGQKKYEIGWVDDKLHGPSIAWWDNGEKQAVKHYSHGIINGPYSEWSSEGVKVRHGDYRNGEPVGTWRLSFKFEYPFTPGWRHIEVDTGSPIVGTRAELLCKLDVWNTVMGIDVPFFSPFQCKGSGVMPSKEHFFRSCGRPASDEPMELQGPLDPYLRRWVYRCTDGNLELDIWLSRDRETVRWATTLPE